MDLQTGVRLIGFRYLGSMNPDPDLRGEAAFGSVPVQCLLDIDGAIRCCCCRWKYNEETITGVIVFCTAMRGEERAQGLVVPADEMVPGVIADGVDEVGRPDDVGEHHGPNDALGEAVRLPRRGGSW